jgi:hypothetical protein
MSWVSFLALFFITWWVVLFAILPFSLRTQDEDEDVTLGTVSSAPRGPHMLRAVLRTTIVTRRHPAHRAGFQPESRKLDRRVRLATSCMRAPIWAGSRCRFRTGCAGAR